MVCGKSLDTATLKRSVVLENRISILSIDTFLLWIFIELNSLSTFENWWKKKKMLAMNVLTIQRRGVHIVSTQVRYPAGFTFFLSRTILNTLYQKPVIDHCPWPSSQFNKWHAQNKLLSYCHREGSLPPPPQHQRTLFLYYLDKNQHLRIMQSCFSQL
jgi:hypothetical protein